MKRGVDYCSTYSKMTWAAIILTYATLLSLNGISLAKGMSLHQKNCLLCYCKCNWRLYIEFNNPETECPEHLPIPCGGPMGGCYSSLQHCNGFKECFYGEDEINCTGKIIGYSV